MRRQPMEPQPVAPLVSMGASSSGRLYEAEAETARLKLVLRATEEQLELTKADLRKANIAADQCLEVRITPIFYHVSCGLQGCRKHG